jgi:hypothetical protein
LAWAFFAVFALKTAVSPNNNINHVGAQKMKLQLFKKIFSALIVLVCMSSQANAALITSNFSDLGSNQWSVDLSLTNDRDAAGINEFTVYFSETLFANLSVISSPADWDGFVAQSDLSLGWPGFFDSYNPLGLGLGNSQSGFKIGFTFLGQGTPSPLAFDIIGADFLPTSSGTSTNVTSKVPEPATGVLMLVGCVILGLRRRVNVKTSVQHGVAA